MDLLQVPMLMSALNQTVILGVGLGVKCICKHIQISSHEILEGILDAWTPDAGSLMSAMHSFIPQVYS